MTKKLVPRSANKWPQNMDQLMRVTNSRGYHYWSNSTYHGARVHRAFGLKAGRVFVESETNPFVRESRKVRIHMVKLVEQNQQFQWSVRSIGEPGDQLVTFDEGTENERQVAYDQSVAIAAGHGLARLVEAGVIPDRLEMGMDVAIARFLKIPGCQDGNAHGWVLMDKPKLQWENEG
jgi:hypothetical protein